MSYITAYSVFEVPTLIRGRSMVENGAEAETVLLYIVYRDSFSLFMQMILKAWTAFAETAMY